MKRGQISLFIIIGMVVIIIASIILYFSYNSMIGPADAQSEKSKDLFETSAIKDHINSCLYKTVKEGIIQVGIREDNLSRYIEKNLESCINFGFFEDQGFDIKKGVVEASVVTLDEQVIADLNYSLQMQRDEGNTVFGAFHVKFPLVMVQSLELDNRGLVARDLIVYSTLDDSELRIRKGTNITLDGRGVSSVGIKVIDLSTANSTDYIAHKLLPIGANVSPPVQFAVSFDDLKQKGEELQLASFDQIIHRWLFYKTHINSTTKHAIMNVSRFRAIDLLRYTSACDQFVNSSYDEDSTEYFSPYLNESNIFCKTVKGLRDCGAGKRCLISSTFPSDAGSGTSAGCCPNDQCVNKVGSCSSLGGVICDYDDLCVDGSFVSSTDAGSDDHALCCRDGFCQTKPEIVVADSNSPVDCQGDDSEYDCPSKTSGCIIIDDTMHDFCLIGHAWKDDGEGYNATEFYTSVLPDYGRFPDQRAVWAIGPYNIAPGKYDVYVSFDATCNRPSKDVQWYLVHSQEVEYFINTQQYILDGSIPPLCPPKDCCYEDLRRMCLHLGEFEFDGNPSEAVVMDPRKSNPVGSGDIDAIVLCRT